MPEKGHNKLVKTAVNTGKPYSYPVYLMSVVIGMMHVALSHFRGSRDRKEILLTDSTFFSVQLGWYFTLQDIKILYWCPAGSVLPHGEKVPL